MTMAIAVTSPHHLDFVPSEAIPPAPGEVMLRIVRGGICGSDLHIFHGTNPYATYPRVIGHEFGGIVETVGDGVTGLREGDHVVVDPVVSCGVCYPCRIGRSNVCARLEVIGVHRDGGFRPFVTLPADNAIKVSPDLPFDVATLAEPFSIAANALLRTGCDPTDHVLLYGAGTVGLTMLQVAKLEGARVMIADPDGARLERAARFGADITARTGVDDIDALARAMNGGLGPTLVIDCAGVPALMEDACRLAGPAGRVAIMGFSPQPTTIIQQQINSKELTVYGSRLNRKLLPKVVDWLETGALAPAAMVTQTYPAADARAAFELFENEPHKTIKIQLAFD
ncbi:zinc-binding alcohol dehydrogenase family protein [Acuticoccus sp. M5D2P5]|uniref:zinc-binding alcohol dehydrogenase family protein n=1 Tax=Acuticoccus kalidii TaxID=2910977 RepID=UPI001F2562BE|nr:zinc-binding alcohol dehydrogenase family protein [Acuticoccus kalidii]MCF3934258.1 zinc-binding alcohol dehydrogenase family protein [Acuticoccus kalidii]